MGMFSFVTDAGAKLFGMDTTSPEEKVTNIKNMVTQELALPVKFFNCTVDDETAIITGVAKDMSTQEKTIVAVGNIKGIGNVSNCMTVAPANIAAEEVTATTGETMEASAQFHTVKSGDTLGGIAKTYYGSAGKYPVIFEANKPMLTDPNKIYPGQTLRIPGKETNLA